VLVPLEALLVGTPLRPQPSYTSRDVWVLVIPIATRQPEPRGSGCARQHVASVSAAGLTSTCPTAGSVVRRDASLASDSALK
jgi:hypothetical protein